MRYLIIIAILLIGCAKKQVIKTVPIPEPEIKIEKQEIEPSENMLDLGPPEPMNFSPVLFPFDSDVPIDRTGIRELAEYLEETLHRVALEGHACEIGPETYNMTLSEKRANMVYNELIAYGIKTERIETQAYGEGRPKSEYLPDNRRVEIKIK